MDISLIVNILVKDNDTNINKKVGAYFDLQYIIISWVICVQLFCMEY